MLVGSHGAEPGGVVVATAPRPRHWAHNGIASMAGGLLVTFSAGNDIMRIITSDGELVAEHATPVICAHGVAVTSDATGGELVWVADTASTAGMDADGTYCYWSALPHGRTIALTLDGTVERELPLPPLPIYRRRRFEPTAVLPMPMIDQIWVSDGYGTGLIHRYRYSGDYLRVAPASRDGAFRCPHAMVLDERGRQPLVLVADQEDNRIVALDLAGERVATVAEHLRRPSCLAVDGPTLLVGELSASVAQLDVAGELIRRIGLDLAANDRPGWPNALDRRGATVRPELTRGRFNSPHGITIDAQGRAHVVEWVLGGRHLRFARHDADPVRIEEITLSECPQRVSLAGVRYD